MKKYIGLEEMSNVNCSHVLDVIGHYGEISRKEISDVTGLSWGGMTKIVNKLFEKGYIIEQRSEKNSGQGRIPNVISINKQQNYVIGLDVNRMGLNAYVMNLAGEILAEYAEEGSFDNREELLSTILSFVKKIMDEYSGKKILAIGVAMQGILDVEKGISVKFPRCRNWKNVPIKDILSEEFQTEVFVEHDPNCILYSVMRDTEKKEMMLLRIDSSVGMAISLKGKILRGTGLLEVAHQVIVPEGKKCRCGQRGCLESYISPCFVNKELQVSAVADMIQPMSIFMSNMCRLFHSEEIILTGKLVRYKDFFAKSLLEKFYQYCSREEVSVRFIEETDRAVHGAALIAVQGAIDKIKI